MEFEVVSANSAWPTVCAFVSTRVSDPKNRNPKQAITAILHARVITTLTVN